MMGILGEIEQAKRDLIDALNMMQLRERQYQAVDPRDKLMHDAALARWEAAKSVYAAAKLHYVALVERRELVTV